jgi:hypothetical protein
VSEAHNGASISIHSLLKLLLLLLLLLLLFDRCSARSPTCRATSTSSAKMSAE